MDEEEDNKKRRYKEGLKLFMDGKKPIDLVIEHDYHPEEVKEIYKQYLALLELESNPREPSQKKEGESRYLDMTDCARGVDEGFEKEGWEKISFFTQLKNLPDNIWANLISLFLIGLLLSLLDVVTTVWAIVYAGAIEANPLMYYLMEIMGLTPALMLNIILSVIILVVLLYGTVKYSYSGKRAWYLPLIIFAVIRAIPVINNIYWIYIY